MRKGLDGGENQEKTEKKNIKENYINFIKFWENGDDVPGFHPVDFTHQQVNNGLTSVSIIDHFSNVPLYDIVKEAGVIHHGENPSNHSPIYVSIQFEEIDRNKEKAKLGQVI